MQTQLKWLTALQAIEDRLRDLRGRRRTRRCLEELQSLEKQKNRLKQRIEPSLLRRFEILLERRQGKAIVPIRGKSCGACGLVLPVQTVIDVQTREFIITCESCARFLYWGREEARIPSKPRKELPTPRGVAAKATSGERVSPPERRKLARKKAATKKKPAGRVKPPAKKEVTVKKKAAAKKKVPKKKAAAVKKAAAKKAVSKKKAATAKKAAAKKKTSAKRIAGTRAVSSQTKRKSPARPAKS